MKRENDRSANENFNSDKDVKLTEGRNSDLTHKCKDNEGKLIAIEENLFASKRENDSLHSENGFVRRQNDDLAQE